MTEDTNEATLPIELTETGSPIMGWFMAAMWGLLAMLIVVAWIADMITEGFTKNWWLVLLSLPLWLLFYFALASARKLAYYTITADEVSARVRVIKGWSAWTEPMGTYRSVEISSEHHNVGQGAAHSSYTATLIHSRDSSKNVRLNGWGWSRHGDLDRDELEAATEDYANKTMALLGLSDTEAE